MKRLAIVLYVENKNNYLPFSLFNRTVTEVRNFNNHFLHENDFIGAQKLLSLLILRSKFNRCDYLHNDRNFR